MDRSKEQLYSGLWTQADKPAESWSVQLGTFADGTKVLLAVSGSPKIFFDFFGSG